MKAKMPLLLAASALALAVALPARSMTVSAAGPAPPAEASWKTVAAAGPVQARAADAAETAAWLAVSRGDELMPRTLVETGRKGRITLARSASLIVVDPSSRVELPGTGLGQMETSVVQTQGSVLYKVEKRSTPHFEVVTPFLVAGVKGTSFLVTVNERYAAVTVQEGRVEITNPGTGESVMLGPGDSVVRQREDVAMELVRDERRSREARKETARLERMDRREDQRDDEPEVTSAPEADEDAQLSVKEAREETQDSWAEEDAAAGALGTEVEELTKELNEEMIREEVKDGVIAVPGDDGITIFPPIKPPVDPQAPQTPVLLP